MYNGRSHGDMRGPDFVQELDTPTLHHGLDFYRGELEHTPRNHHHGLDFYRGELEHTPPTLYHGLDFYAGELGQTPILHHGLDY